MQTDTVHMTRIFMIAFLAFMSSAVFGQTWNGSTSSDWNNASNWNGGVPSSNSAVTIPGNTSFNPIISTAVTVKSITVGDWNNATILTVNGGDFTVSENVTLVNYGELKMESGSITFSKAKNNSSFSFAYTSAAITLVNGTFTSNLDIQVNGAMNTGSATVVMGGILTAASGKTISSTAGNWTLNGSLVVNGTLDLGATDINANSTTTVSSGGIFNAGSGNIHFYQTLDVGNSGILNAEDANITIHQDLSAKQSAYLSVNDGSITFLGDVDLQQSATLEVKGTGALNINGDGQFKQNGVLLVGTGSLNLQGNVDFQQGGTLEVTTGSVDIQGDATFNQSGTFNAEEATITVSGDLILGSGGSTFNAGGSTISLEGGTFENSGTFNADSSTVVFTGTGSQTIQGDVTFYNMEIETDGQLSTTGNVTVTNNAAIDTTSALSVGAGSTFEVQGELDDPAETVSSTAPYVRTVSATSATEIEIVFSEAISSSTASNLSNYSLDGSVTIASAVLQQDAKMVLLTTSTTLSENQLYTLVMNNIASAASNTTVSVNHTRRFTYIKPIIVPTHPLSDLQIVQHNGTSAQITWSKKASLGSFMVLRAASASTSQPTDGTNYSFNTNWNDAPTLPDGSRIVYAGNDSTLTVEGLRPNTDYHLTGYTYSGSIASEAAFLKSNAPTATFTTSFTLDITHVLAGSFDEASNQMVATLPQTGLFPTAQPYNTAPYNYAGSENLSATVGDTIVDWVLIELRGTSTASSAFDNTVVARRAAVLTESGKVRAADQTSLLEFQLESSTPLVVVVYHRNHVPVMSADTIGLNPQGVYSIDFAHGSNNWFDSNSASVSEDNVKMSARGLINSQFGLDQSQAVKVWDARNANGYSAEDVNLDGHVDANDRAELFNDRNVTVTLPVGQ